MHRTSEAENIAKNAINLSTPLNDSIIWNYCSAAKIISKNLEVYLILVQRKTQTPAYWQSQFTVSNKDIESIYNQILEENRIFKLDDIALTLVRRQCQAEELAARSEFQQGKLYQPKES